MIELGWACVNINERMPNINLSKKDIYWKTQLKKTSGEANLGKKMA